MSEIIAKKRVYVCQGCPKGTTKAVNCAFCWTCLLVSHTAIICICMHAPYPEQMLTHVHAGYIDQIFAGSMNDGNC